MRHAVGCGGRRAARRGARRSSASTRRPGIATELLDARGARRGRAESATRISPARCAFRATAWCIRRARRCACSSWRARAARRCARDVAVREIRRERRATATARRFDADVVVNAAGPSAALLTPGLPIVPRKGHLAITDRYPGFCRHQLVELGYLTSAHVMTNESVAFNVQPRSTGQVLIGSSRELVGWDASINHDDSSANAAARDRVHARRCASCRSFALGRGFVRRRRTSCRSSGAWEPTPGLWIAAGHEGLGITTSLATARLLADQIAGRAPAIDRVAVLRRRACSTRQPRSARVSADTVEIIVDGRAIRRDAGATRRERAAQRRRDRRSVRRRAASRARRCAAWACATSAA